MAFGMVTRAIVEGTLLDCFACEVLEYGWMIGVDSWDVGVGEVDDTPFMTRADFRVGG